MKYFKKIRSWYKSFELSFWRFVIFLPFVPIAYMCGLYLYFYSRFYNRLAPKLSDIAGDDQGEFY